MNIPKNLKYTRTHEWVRVENHTAVVGITEHAQQKLTDIVYVELPALHTKVEAGKECAVVESVKAASDIYAPVSGEIVAVNEQLTSAPELLNEDPYGRGWIFKINLTAPAELEQLMSPDEYAQHIGA